MKGGRKEVLQEGTEETEGGGAEGSESEVGTGLRGFTGLDGGASGSLGRKGAFEDGGDFTGVAVEGPRKEVHEFPAVGAVFVETRVKDVVVQFGGEEAGRVDDESGVFEFLHGGRWSSAG